MTDVASVGVFGVDRRLHPRESASDPIKAVDAHGQVFDLLVVDRSMRGLRVYSAAAFSLPTELTLLVPSAGLVHLARIVWRTPPYAGLLLTRTIEMRRAAGTDAEEARRLWRLHVAGR